MINARSITVSLLALSVLAGGAVTTMAADDKAAGAEGGHGIHIERQQWSFSGVGGKYDKQQLQRGFGVYKQVCSACHSLNRIAFRNLSEPGGPQFNVERVKALAATYEVPAAPNDEGEIKPRPALLSDRFPNLYANEKAARAAQNGALPPDLSVIARARGVAYTGTWYAHPFSMLRDIATAYQEGGADYIYALLTGYADAPSNMKVPDGLNYNKAFPGHLIAMAAPLSDGLGIYNDGTAETTDNYARDVAAFLSWAADPTLNQRKSTGWIALLFLVVTALLLYISKRRIWAGVKH